MNNQIKAVIVDDETILLDGQTLVATDELSDVLSSALQNDPDFILVIEPRSSEYYKATGKVIYASQRVGVPVENLRITTEDGDVVTFEELRARNSNPPV